MLPQAVARLGAGGRVAVVTFHSLEDRIVKRFFARAARPEVPVDLPLRASEMPPPQLTLVGRACRPSDVEVAENPRARSARLRIAERTGASFDAAALLCPEADWRS